MKVLLCKCSSMNAVPDDVRDAVAALAQQDGDVEILPDLCELAANRDERLAQWAAEGDLVVVACYPRTVRWLFDWAGSPLTDANTRYLNMREQGAGAVLDELGAEPAPAPTAAAEEPSAPEWPPWFPVIDRDLCRNCKQCLNFCPFGVYEISGEDRVEVRHPRKCKTNCPACARLCPEVAIIFPKYTKAPINGAEVKAEHVQQRRESALAERLKKEDVHSILAQRGACARDCQRGNPTP